MLLILVIVALSGGLLTGCGKQTTTKGINVVSSVNFYGETAQAVLGKHGKVTSIIDNANIDPHDFQPTPKNAEQVAKANVVISNGMNYDSWFKTLTASNATKATNVNVQTLMHKNSNDNPHLWYDIQTMSKLARHLAHIFGQKDPKHRHEYQQNATKFIQSLAPLDKIIAQQKHGHHNRQVAVSEPVFNYALAAMGYQVSDGDFAKAIENGTDPSPQSIHNLQQAIKHHQIRFFVLNSQTSDKIVMNMVKMAQQHHVPVVKVTETMPNQQNSYRNWMLSEYRQVANIK